MMPRLLRKCWTNLLIAFDDDFTLEGFERTHKKFQLPENFTWLAAPLKRNLTICNLFGNQNQSIRDIARVLDVNTGQVVSVLIENGLIKERRREAKSIRQGKRPEDTGFPRAMA